jgi:hypothetical protein
MHTLIDEDGPSQKGEKMEKYRSRKWEEESPQAEKVR